jgi:hypothetical protein
MTRARDLSNDEANNGGATPPFVAGKNVVINGNFDIWQRGTSFSNSTGYSVDRFTQTIAASGSSVTVTRETTVPNPNSIYSVKYAQVGAATSVVEYAARYWPETQDAMRLAGKTVTLSFWYRSNKTGTHGARMSNGLQTGGADAAFGFNIVAANTWQYISWTTSVPYGGITAITTAPNAGVGILDIGFRVGGAGVGFTALSDGDYFQLSQVQLEIGSVATPFSRAGGSIGGELALCQRYYERINWDSLAGYATFGQGAAQTTLNVRTLVPFLVQKRVKPTAIDFPTVSTNFRVIDFADNVPGSATAVAFDGNQTSTSVGYLNWTTTGAVQNRPYLVTGNNTASAYLGWSAEL